MTICYDNMFPAACYDATSVCRNIGQYLEYNGTDYNFSSSYASHTLPRKGHVQSLGHGNEIDSASLQWRQGEGFMPEEIDAAMRGAAAGFSLS